LRTGQSWDLELQLVTARGRPLWVRATGVAELDPRGVCAKVFGALQDVTERHRADERIRRLAHYDELTGLANRNLFTYHLGHVLSRAERYTKQLAVLFIDLDRFKIINDTLGHDTGDRVLETIARRLSEQMRASDLVARLSGDEFMVVVEEIEGPGVVEDVARKLLRAIEEPVQHQGQEFSLSGSIGIAVYPQDGRDQQSLLKHADIAMYRAKDQGKNGFEFYSSGMNAASVERFSLESKLKRAVVDQNQFVLHYQPKVSVADGRIVGAEALVRWVSPDRGLIPPGEFIPLAEETGLIGAIGEWVLTNACRQAAEWAAKGLPTVRVAVNLSARQLYSPGFLATVRQALADSGVNPGGMELEITESVMMHHVEQVAEVLGELKLLGVHVAVDDFGTGYSSLAYLKRLPLDSLKVDRSFVRDVPGDPDDEAITRAVVALAHSLRLKVVAEGVETEEQLGFLCELGCDEIQGFLFSRPVPAADFEELLRRDVRLPRPAGSDDPRSLIAALHPRCPRPRRRSSMQRCPRNAGIVSSGTACDFASASIASSTIAGTLNPVWSRISRMHVGLVTFTSVRWSPITSRPTISSPAAFSAGPSVSAISRSRADSACATPRPPAARLPRVSPAFGIRASAYGAGTPSITRIRLSPWTIAGR
jgi:diguanylate cyclase (GGDEF)-like protein